MTDKNKENHTFNENEAYIKPPAKLPFYIKIFSWAAKKKLGKDLLLPKLLAWYPKAAASSGLMEALAAGGNKTVSKRMLKLIRIQASLSVSCPFCVDMNALEYEKAGITGEEAEAVINGLADACESLSEKEKTALEYVRRISATPVDMSGGFPEKINAYFTEKETVIIASTAAQVNYWSRLIRALGVPAAGFTEYCRIKTG